MQLKSLWSKLFICITCIHVKTIDVFMCVSLSFVPVVLSPSFVFLVSCSLDLMFCKCTYWDPRITTLRVVSSYMALVYVTALQALIWFAVAWKSVGNHFTLAVYTFLKSDKREKKHAETNTDILVLFINVCEFVCVCVQSDRRTHLCTFQTAIVLRFLKSKTFIEWKTLIQSLDCIVLAAITHLQQTTIPNHNIFHSFSLSIYRPTSFCSGIRWWMYHLWVLLVWWIRSDWMHAVWNCMSKYFIAKFKHIHSFCSQKLKTQCHKQTSELISTMNERNDSLKLLGYFWGARKVRRWYI